jgi:hypothetical protein
LKADIDFFFREGKTPIHQNIIKILMYVETGHGRCSRVHRKKIGGHDHDPPYPDPTKQDDFRHPVTQGLLKRELRTFRFARWMSLTGPEAGIGTE